MNEDETDKTSNLMEDLPRLDRKQKLLLQKSWTKLHSKMDTVGVVTFLHLFETHPKTLKPFLHHINSAKEMEMDEWYQEKLRDHALRVMAVVEKTMHRLDREEKAAQMLSVYGKRHCGYGVTPEMLDLMGESFVVSFQHVLEEDWTLEVEEAWRQLFKFIGHCMKCSYPADSEIESKTVSKEASKCCMKGVESSPDPSELSLKLKLKLSKKLSKEVQNNKITNEGSQGENNKITNEGSQGDIGDLDSGFGVSQDDVK